MTYFAMKTIHMLGVIFLLGNVSVTFMWKLFADDTENPVIVAFAQRTVIWNDWAFTVIGVLMIIVSGYGMAWSTGLDPIGIDWLFWSQAWFYSAGLLWLFVLVPIQVIQGRQASQLEPDDPIPNSFRRLTLHWNIWGVLATLMLLVPLWLMIAK